MQLVQSRMITDDVRGLAGFYAQLVGASVVLNDFYVEVPTGAMSVGFSKCRFTEFDGPEPAAPGGARDEGRVVLDFLVDDVDAEYGRIDGLDVGWVLPPTTQPWGNRSMVLRDPEGHLVNVFSRCETERR